MSLCRTEPCKLDLAWNPKYNVPFGYYASPARTSQKQLSPSYIYKQCGIDL